jgi:hypothetical protein
VAAAVGLGPEHLRGGGHVAQVEFQLPRQDGLGAGGPRVQDGPGLGQVIEDYQGEWMLGPAGAQPGRQVPVHRFVDAPDPVPEPAGRLRAVFPLQVVPARRRDRLVAVTGVVLLQELEVFVQARQQVGVAGDRLTQQVQLRSVGADLGAQLVYRASG